MGMPDIKVTKIKYFKPKSGAPQYFPSVADIEKYWSGDVFASCIGFDNVKKELGELPPCLIGIYENEEFVRVEREANVNA